LSELETPHVGGALAHGMVGSNNGVFSPAMAPLGGVKPFGLGRVKCATGIDEHVATKYLCMGY
jgi:acyl-CoA reductase-like NAD-dependent aldehyde dehydrogenase